jgi:hypothetical protein
MSWLCTYKIIRDSTVKYELVKHAFCFNLQAKESHQLMKLYFNIMDFAEVTILLSCRERQWVSQFRSWTGTQKYDGVKPVNEVQTTPLDNWIFNSKTYINKAKIKLNHCITTISKTRIMFQFAWQGITSIDETIF